MRLLTHHAADGPRAGVLLGDLVIEAKVAAEAAGIDGHRQCSWGSARALLELEASARQHLADAAADVARGGGAGVIPLADVELSPPIPDPDKIVGVGLNYRDHAEEMRLEAPEAPTLSRSSATRFLAAADRSCYPGRAARSTLRASWLS